MQLQNENFINLGPHLFKPGAFATCPVALTPIYTDNATVAGLTYLGFGNRCCLKQSANLCCIVHKDPVDTL